MAVIHLSGTRLAPKKPKAPLNRQLMYALGFVYLIAMHSFAPNLNESGLSLPFNSVTWFSLSWVFAIGIYQVARTQRIRYSKLTIGLLLSCLFISIPLMYPSSSIISVLPRLIGLWLGWLLFFSLQQFSLSNAHKQRILWFIILASLIEALLAYGQFFFLTQGNLFAYDSVMNQPYGIFQNINTMSSFLTTGLVLSGYLLARQQRKYGEKLSRTTLLYITPVVIVPIIILLASRTGWIIALLSVLLIIPYLYRFSTNKRLVGWLVSLVSGIGLGLIIAHSSGNTQYVSGEVDIESARQTVLPQAVDMFIEKPFTGYGFDRFESEYILYTARQHQLNPQYPVAVQDVSHPFNEVLLWGIEGGILSVFGIVLAALLVAFKIGGTRKGTRLAILTLLLPIALHAQIEDPFYQSSIHWVTFVILVFWVDQRTANYKNYNISTMAQKITRPISIALPLSLASYMLVTLHTNYQLVEFDKSSPKKLEILDNIIFPMSLNNEVAWQKKSTQLRAGLVNKNLDKVNGYIAWALKSIKQNPNEALYRHLILAYLGKGEISKAEQIRDEAKYLFPMQDFSTLDIAPVGFNKALAN